MEVQLFQPQWMKWTASGIYVAGLPVSAISLVFAFQELNGHSGLHQTAINRLLALNHVIISIYNIVLMGIDLFHVWYDGPLPWPFCEVFFLTKTTVYLSVCGLLMAITILKYLIVCVWKGFHENLEDIALSRTVAQIVVFLALTISLFGEIISQRPPINQMICAENFDQINESRLFPTVAIVSLICVIVIVATGIPTFLAMKRGEDADGAANDQAVPKSFESLGTNVLIVLGIFGQHIMATMFKPQTNPKAFMVMALEVLFFAPTCVLSLMVISIYLKKRARAQAQQHPA